MTFRILITLFCITWTAAYAQESEAVSGTDVAPAESTEKSKADLKAKFEKAAAKAAKRKSRYPVSGTVGTAYTANHANFVESEGDFGTQLLSINGGINYAAHQNLILNTGVSTRKSIVNDFFSRGAGTSTSEQPWEIGDVRVGASFGNVYTIPVANIGITAGSSLSFPLSRTSQAYGMIAAGTANTALGWRQGKFNMGLSLRATYNWTEDATIPVDCVKAPDVCRISGADTGIPVSLINYGTGISAGYGFLDGKLNISTSYGLSSGISAAKFEEDENTADYAQSGTQYGNLAQSFGLTAAYRVFTKTNVALIMRTAGTFFTNDNKSWRFPLFDTESDLHQRTSYTLSVTQSF